MTIDVAAALAKFVEITCPHCGHSKRVERKPASCRVCPRCRRQFADPLGATAPVMLDEAAAPPPK